MLSARNQSGHLALVVADTRTGVLVHAELANMVSSEDLPSGGSAHGLSTAALPLPQLLTARQLVGELGRLGAGHWTPDAVRQWIREELPCPIAAPGALGQPHRYSLVSVLDWLLARQQRERAKGYTRADGVDAAQQLTQALRRAQSEQQSAAQLASSASAVDRACAGSADTAPSVADRQGRPADPDVALLAQAVGVTPRALSRALDAHSLVISRFRDPRNAKAHEEMRLARMRADAAEGKLVPADQVERLIADIVLPARSALLGLRVDLGNALDSCATPEARRAEIERAVHRVLDRLSAPDQLAPADAGAE